MGNKFGYGNLLETTLVPEISTWDYGSITPDLIFSSNNANNSGAIYEWFNQNYSNSKVILIFGNSIFERGGSSFGLTWWISRYYKRTVFCWSSAVDPSLVEKYAPDIVVCQTVERFLPIIPIK